MGTGESGRTVRAIERENGESGRKVWKPRGALSPSSFASDKKKRNGGMCRIADHRRRVKGHIRT